MEYKVTEKDLIGQIEDFPIEVVQRMVDCQLEQDNKACIDVLQGEKTGGFEWRKTKEGLDFWHKVIEHKKFNLFFQKYPKQNQLTIEKDMETNNKVWIRGVLGRGDEVINELIKLGGNNHGLSGAILDDIYYIGPDNSIEFIRDDIKRAKEIMAEYKEIKLDDNPSITAFQDYGLHFSKDLSTFAKTCINLPEGSSVNICNENGKVMIIVEPKQVKEEECRFKDGDILLLTNNDGFEYIAIFKEMDNAIIYVYTSINITNNRIGENNGFFRDKMSNVRKADYDEQEKMFKELANQKHLRWNAEEFKFEPIRWRAEYGGKYWYIGDDGEIYESTDIRSCFDKSRYNFCNYFQTKELIKQAFPKLKEFFKSLSL